MATGFVRLHFVTGIIEGYLEGELVDKLGKLYEKQSRAVFTLYLRKAKPPTTDVKMLKFKPSDLLLIESKMV